VKYMSGDYDYSSHDWSGAPDKWAVFAFEQCFPTALPVSESRSSRIGVDFLLGTHRIQVKSDMRATCYIPNKSPTQRIAIQRQKITWNDDGSQASDTWRSEPSWDQTDFYFHFLGSEALFYSKIVRDQLIDGKPLQMILPTSKAYLVPLTQVRAREDVYVCQEIRDHHR
jgi:hypothetical protein